MSAFGKRRGYRLDIVPFGRSDDDLFQIAPIFNPYHALEALFPADDDFAVGAASFMEQSLLGAQDAGWDHGSTSFLNGPIADHELHAVWQINTYPVTFLDAKFCQSSS